MMYTHVLNRGGMGVKSPMDDLWRRYEGAYTETIYPPSFIAELSLIFYQYRY